MIELRASFIKPSMALMKPLDQKAQADFGGSFNAIGARPAMAAQCLKRNSTSNMVVWHVQVCVPKGAGSYFGDVSTLLDTRATATARATILTMLYRCHTRYRRQGYTGTDVQRCKGTWALTYKDVRAHRYKGQTCTTDVQACRHTGITCTCVQSRMCTMLAYRRREVQVHMGADT